MRSFASPTPTSPQKKMTFNNVTSPSSNGGARQHSHKMTFSERKALEKEEEHYERMFNLFDSKAEIQYLDSYEDDKLAASVYSDAKSSTSSNKKKGKKLTLGGQLKPGMSGYNFEELLKNENSWRQM